METQLFYKTRELFEALEQTSGNLKDFPETLEDIVQIAQKVFQADACAIIAMNPITKRLISSQSGSRTLQKSNFEILELALPEWLVQKFLEQSVFVIEDLALMPELHTTFTPLEGARSLAALALRMRHHQKAPSVLYLYFKQQQQFNTEELELFQFFAYQASFILRETWLLRRYQIVARIGQDINHELATVDILFQKLRKHVVDILDMSCFVLTIYQSQTNTLDVYIQENGEFIHRNEVPLQGVSKYVLESKKTLFIRHMSKEADLQAFQITDTPGIGSHESFIFVPLVLGDESIGVVSIQHFQPNAYNQEDQFILEQLANHIALALHNIGLFSSLGQLNETGQLLTEQIESKQILQTTVDKIRDVAQADVVVLYPYERIPQRFVFPPCLAGTLLNSSIKPLLSSQADNIASLMLGYKKPIFAKESAILYTELYGNEYIQKRNFQERENIRSTAAVPLQVRGETVGVLVVNFRQPQRFDATQKLLIEGLAHYAAIAIKNVQAYEREKRLAEEAQVLNEISREITSQLDHVQVFDLILEKALELTHSHMGNLMLYDPELNDLWMATERGAMKEKKGKRQGLHEGIAGYVATHKQLLNIVDVTHPSWSEIFLEYIFGTHSVLAVPMLAGNEIRGVLNVESPSPHNFSERDERLLQRLADLAVVALQNAERYEKATRDAQRFELLYQAGQELGKITDLAQLEQAYDVIVQIVERHSQSQVVIYRYDETNAELVLKCASKNRQAFPFDLIKLDEGLNGQVAREQNTLVRDDIKHLPSDIAPIKQSDPGMHSFVVIPIQFKDRYYGNLGLRNEDSGYFRSTDILFFEGLSQQLASTIYRLETVQARQDSEQRVKAAEEMSLIGQSVFEVTHRLGNDLGLVRSYVNDIRSELKRLDVTNILISEKLDNIVRAARTVLGLSKGLKHVLIRSHEAMVHVPIIINPRALLEEAKNISSLPSTIQIGLKIDEDVAMVQIIYRLVADILHNLVTNAIEAMPEGGEITLSAYNTGRFVALEVSDTGPGISQQNLPKIFDLFYSTKGSTGFGLWSARRNALKNRGDLTVKSKVGHGTTFTLLLPKLERGTS